MSEPTVCPRCKGEDRTKGFMFVNRGEAGCTVEPSHACEMCGGAGTVDSQQLEQYEIGREFHRQRIHAGHHTLLDVGNRWGFSPAEISKAERIGVGDPLIFAHMLNELAAQRVPGAHTAPEPTTATQHTGDGDGGYL